MSKSHSGGAYFVHFTIDKMTDFELAAIDAQTLRMHVFTTAGEKVGDAGVFSDNSGAIGVI